MLKRPLNGRSSAAYVCLVAGQSLWVYARSVCDTKAPLQLHYAACDSTIINM